jgi:tetrahydromethanopterin S-methyltransferase subunit F
MQRKSRLNSGKEVNRVVTTISAFLASVVLQVRQQALFTSTAPSVSP